MGRIVDIREDMMRLGADVEASYVQPMSRLVDGVTRPLTNVEMMASLATRSDDVLLDNAMRVWSECFVCWVDRGCVEIERYN